VTWPNTNVMAAVSGLPAYQQHLALPRTAGGGVALARAAATAPPARVAAAAPPRSERAGGGPASLGRYVDTYA
jgi:hypothetical protein